MYILKVRRYGMGNEYAFRCLVVLAWRLRLRKGYFCWNTMFSFHSLHFVKGCVLIVDNGRTSFVWSVLKVEIKVVLTIFYIVYLLALCVAWRLGLRNGYFCWNIMCLVFTHYISLRGALIVDDGRTSFVWSVFEGGNNLRTSAAIFITEKWRVCTEGFNAHLFPIKNLKNSIFCSVTICSTFTIRKSVMIMRWKVS